MWLLLCKINRRKPAWMQSARRCANVQSMLPHPRHARAEGLHSPSSLPCTIMHQHQESIMWNVNISTYVLLSFLISYFSWFSFLPFFTSEVPEFHSKNWVLKHWRSSATIATNLQSPRVGLQPQGISALQFADVAPFQKGCQRNWVVSAWATKARPSDMGVSLCQCFTAVTLETTMAAVHRSPLMPHRHMSTTQRHIATCPTKISRQDAATEFAKVFSSWWSRTRFSHASHYKLWLQRLISWF